MKKTMKALIAFSVIITASAAFANPKCSHRVGSAQNDLLKNTNPAPTQSVVKSGAQSVRSGVK